MKVSGQTVHVPFDLMYLVVIAALADKEKPRRGIRALLDYTEFDMQGDRLILSWVPHRDIADERDVRRGELAAVLLAQIRGDVAERLEFLERQYAQFASTPPRPGLDSAR